MKVRAFSFKLGAIFMCKLAKATWKSVITINQ